MFNNEQKKPLFKTEYIIRLTGEEMGKYAVENRCSISITDKRLSHKIMRENLELKQQLSLKNRQIKSLEKKVK